MTTRTDAPGVLIEESPDSNATLVEACLRGDQQAWISLIDKYKRLIFSIPVKFGLDRNDAADIFQGVCLDLVTALPNLREPEALPQWLIRTTWHKCIRDKAQRQHHAAINTATSHVSHTSQDMPDSMVSALQQEQALRDAVRTLPPRCRLMVEMLFFETPARSYAEVAARLGLAPGSVGFIRGRCLERLRTALRQAGL